MMHYADHHGFPIVTFIDTPGAFADLKSEELGQVCEQLYLYFLLGSLSILGHLICLFCTFRVKLLHKI